MAWIPGEAGSCGNLVRSRAREFLHSKRRRPATQVPAEPANALGSDFTHETCHIQDGPAETWRPQKFQNRRCFKGNAQWLAASWAHLLLPSIIVPHGRDCRRRRQQGWFK